MSNPSGPPSRAGVTPPAGPTPPSGPFSNWDGSAGPGAPGATNGADDTVIRPRADLAGSGPQPEPERPPAERPTLAQRIMNGRERAPGGNGRSAFGSNGSTRGAAPTQRSQPDQQSQPGPAAPAPRSSAPKPAGAPAGQSPAARVAAKLAQPFRDPGRSQPGGDQSTQRERLTTGGAVATGAAAHGVPNPAVTSDQAEAPSSAASANSAARSNKPVLRRTRKARLRLSHVDPWSVMKTAFMFSIAAGIVLVVAVYSLWSVIMASDLFPAVDQMVQDAVGTQGDATPFRLETYINTSKVMGATALIAVLDVMIVTALATLTGFLYNLSASVLGGLEVTLAED